MDKGMLEAKTWYMIFWACIALIHFGTTGYMAYKLYSIDKSANKTDDKVRSIEKNIKKMADRY